MNLIRTRCRDGRWLVHFWCGRWHLALHWLVDVETWKAKRQETVS